LAVAAPKTTATMPSDGRRPPTTTVTDSYRRCPGIFAFDRKAMAARGSMLVVADALVAAAAALSS
jgi:hypothetical protein